MDNQQQHWNQLHAQGTMKDYAQKPTTFAEEAIMHFPKSAVVLEFGCGLGNDAFFFAKRGHKVFATDFSQVAIDQNKKHYQNQPSLRFQVVDMSKPLAFAVHQFTVVCARLSLHYFTDTVTKQLFAEIHRVLKPGGLLCFLCKSVDDPLYGKGERIEKDMFEVDGHVRHFFSLDYAKECLDKKYDIQVIEVGSEDFYGNQSAFVKVIAKKL